MPVSLSKGGNVSLTKEAPGLKNLLVGLGWKPRTTDGAAFDLDVSVFIVDENGKVRNDTDFVFYNNKLGDNGAVEHTGDNRTGEGDGDDEAVKIDLSKVSADVKRLIFAVTIHEAATKGQNFGQVGDAYIRTVNTEGNAEIARFDLSEDASVSTAMIFGEVYRGSTPDDWKLKAVGQGYEGGLAKLAADFGVNLA
ncbi:TerD family protein [Rhizobium sp. BK176]|uniref:TerD family protein n=1 Tax=Rhizobium sp. BK176 TaxID=2587071 RepID=UPI00216836B1|nr:TerD family protein [Rhizobium sp. BK176]MCS4090139.1 tellurium resistance protein TerD [Rhizobium sp. BK176]